VYTDLNNCRPINEHFVWYTLRELTEAMIALHEGPGVCSKPYETAIKPPTSDELPSEPWRPIMHFDLKPNNVLLEVGNTSDYPEYPKPVLADFGISYQGTGAVLDLNQTDGPRDRAPRFGGTLGWLPPVSVTP
jgi:serine/threonine protein kinase